MNHPTDHIDELVMLSQEAIACDDYRQATVFLRRALEMAPLRKDIRAELAHVLAHEQSSIADMDLQHGRMSETRAAQSRAQTAVATGTRPATRSTLRPVSNTGSATAMRGHVDTAALSYGNEARSATTSPRVSVRTEGNVNLQLDDGPLSFSDTAAELDVRYEPSRTALHRLLEDEEEEEVYLAPPPAAPKRRKKIKFINQGPTLEDWIGSFAENCASRLRKMNPARLGYAMCYVVLAAFVALACFQTHRLFGSQKSQRAIATKAAPSRVERKEASIELPSLFSNLQLADPPTRSEDSILEEAKGDLAHKNFDHVIATLEPQIQSGTRSALRDQMRSTLASTYDSKATALLQRSSLEDAVVCYRKSASLQPLEPQYKVHLANALFYLANQSRGANSAATLQEACSIATEVISTEPQHVGAYQVLAETQEALGNKSAARSALQRVVNLSSKTSSAYKRASEHLEALSKGA